MAKKKAKDASEKPRKRFRLNLSLTSEQHAQLQREVPEKERAAYCKERIFHPWDLRDPLIEVGARLLGRTAQAKRLASILDSLEDRLDDDLFRARQLDDQGDEEGFILGLLARENHAELVRVIDEVREIIAPLRDDAREALRLIAAKQEAKKEVPLITRRKDG